MVEGRGLFIRATVMCTSKIAATTGGIPPRTALTGSGSASAPPASSSANGGVFSATGTPRGDQLLAARLEGIARHGSITPAPSNSAIDFNSADSRASVLSVDGGIISRVLVMTSRIVQVHQDPSKTHANGAIRCLIPGASMVPERRGEEPDDRYSQARQRLGWATQLAPRPRWRRPTVTSVLTNARGASVPRWRHHGAPLCQTSDVGKIWGRSEAKPGSRRQSSAENGRGSQHNARWVPVTD